jgi:phenylacetate-CoA ligase
MFPPSPNRQALLSHQLAQLRLLLGAILPLNAFYQKKLAGLQTDIASLPDFFQRFPFTAKHELITDQTAFPPFGSNLTFPPYHYARFHQTSGTTSTPLRWLDTTESWQWMVESWQRIYRVAEVGPGDRVYFAFSFGPFIGFWLAFDAARQLGCLCIPGGGMSSEGRLRAIIDNGATVLCCTPSYAARLAETAAGEKIDLRAARLRTIIVAGEPGGSISATRRRLEQLWPRARLFDHHGMTETGPVSHECPVQAGILHVMEWAYLPEVIHPDGRPVAPGEKGELVLTPLGRAASPLLRYRTGDLVRTVCGDGSPSPCACGRWDLGLAGGILGRVDEMIIVRGVNVYPSAVEEVLGGFADVAEYQVQVDRSAALSELLLRIEPASGCADTDGLVKRIQARLHAVFNLRVPIEIAPAGTLPRFEMKTRRWIEHK